MLANAIIVLAVAAGGMLGIGMLRPRWVWASSRWTVLGRTTVMFAIVIAVAVKFGDQGKPKQPQQTANTPPATQDQINEVIAHYKEQADENGFIGFSATITAIMTADGSAKISYTPGGALVVELYEPNPEKDLMAQLGESTGRVLRALPPSATPHLESLSIHTTIRSTGHMAVNGWANATTARWQRDALRSINLAGLRGAAYFEAADSVTIMPMAIKQARSACQQTDWMRRHPKICAEAR